MDNVKQNEIKDIYESIKEYVEEQTEDLENNMEKCSYNSVFTILSAINKEKNNDE